ncbi:hypothetical protein LEP1GSC103_0819 [Leptospira borgpetersenii serovar Javanica str. UI 09931]|uniref:Uncharacterized protein n=5 Tax=Leptospira borgpetersenii TaxID=174 RepID=M3G9T9_LEPBO|nr:hypothetical protein LBBP_04086 [Leptospira borgpetersenii serovar Ballum]ANH02336.1 Uncharacterized protein LB4E_3208 [Leptospira borgpetersenii str. 4E]EKP11719.1 hypothetical protein LEP1GSC128_1151 [Leptospira borgpetersenii str. 200801926]EKR01028.1 hypothetical protein LEP1GSC121_1566 [Leptospira borgpetersenii serovar Castellonis str. 200801910]EMF97666.1 hypothetical protein LEP1GSC123_1156 [Leptospira borgpetersenii str. 200701203]EMK11854.1 hypothetical protein LEP1GSC066_1970 [Le
MSLYEDKVHFLFLISLVICNGNETDIRVSHVAIYQWL